MELYMNSSVLRGTPRHSSPRPTKLLQGSLRLSLQRHHYRKYESKDSKEFWRSLQISKDSERSPKKRLKDIPKVFKRIQDILKGSKRFQKIPPKTYHWSKLSSVSKKLMCTESLSPQESKNYVCKGACVGLVPTKVVQFYNKWKNAVGFH